MLSIQPLLDKEALLPYLKAIKAPYHLGHYGYKATDKNQELALGLFKIQGDNVQVLYYTTTQLDDPYLFDGVLRAGFNYAGEMGIEKGVIPLQFQKKHEAFFSKLNYPSQPGFLIQNFFTRYKNCNPTS